MNAIRNLWIVVRIHVGMWVLGAEVREVLANHVEVVDFAKVAVRQDGTVTLADCAALADVLYKPIRAPYTLTVSHRFTPESRP